MKLLFICFFIFIGALSGINAQENEENTAVENEEETIESPEEDPSEKKDENEEADSKLRAMAKNRATFLQKELKLNNYTSRVVQKTIYEFSVKANKIIQAEIPEYEKTRGLSTLIYYQNRKLKEVLNVDQFYKYINMR